MIKIYLFLGLFLYTHQGLSATFVVDNNANNDDLLPYLVADGTNTLRKCIRLANTTAGLDRIQFNLVGSTTISNTLAGTAALYRISDPLEIDAYSQPGASAGNPLIEIRGMSLGSWFAFELLNGASTSQLKGLIINGTNVGIRISPAAQFVQIAGCYIGTNSSGLAAAVHPITEDGIRIEGSSNNIIGGSAGLIDRNVIGGCMQEGIRIQAPSSTNNQILGNFIGLAADGSTRLPNRNGLFAESSDDLIIGGPLAVQSNTISGNNGRGIFLVNSSHYIIQGNTIGLDENGLHTVPNNLPGIELVNAADFGLIGGNVSGASNCIAGNQSHGILLNDCDFVSIQANYIGLAKDGTSSRPNLGNGITALNCAFLSIGSGSLMGRNIIASNSGHGVSIYGLDAREALIRGNYIGLSADGTTALGNGAFGLELNECEQSVIGGNTAGSANIISNNAASGIALIASPGCLIKGNLIGMNPAGTLGMGNFQHGIYAVNTSNLTIGGTQWGDRNYIGSNFFNGIELAGTSNNAQIKGNFIGLGKDGATALKNDENGIRSIQSADNMVVGGPSLAERNVIANNGQFTIDTDPDHGFVGDAVRILGTDNHIIQNNFLGTDSSGTIGMGNHWAGVSINDNSHNNQVIDNLIADNRNEGIWIYNGSNHNLIFRNIIGQDILGNPMGNWDYGIVIDVGGCNGNIIGGSMANANLIAHTRGERPTLDGNGVTIGATAGNDNEVSFNNIHCNAAKGILRLAASNANQAAPMVLSSSSNSSNGTGDNGRTIHVYRNTSTDAGNYCDCEGEIYIGTTTVAGGTWSLVHNLGLSPNEAATVTATQTTNTGSSSEFSNCTPPILLSNPSVQLSGESRPQSNWLYWWINTPDNWTTYSLQKSIRGIDWSSIHQINLNNKSPHPKRFSFEDKRLGQELGFYYRLQMNDQTEGYRYSKTIYISNQGQDDGSWSIFPNPSASKLIIEGISPENASFKILNQLGQAILQNIPSKVISEHQIEIDLQMLAAGTYILCNQAGSQKKLFIKL